MVTLHPVTPSQAPRGVKTDTILLAHHLTALIKKQAYPVILALENQRSKGDQNSGTSYQGIAEMVAAVADPGLGICWDMGHATANHLTEGQPLMPYQEFLQETVHTHIHDLSRQGKTHWPLKENQVPVEDFVTALKKNGYRGLYNLELSFSRFRREKDREKSIFDSISRLSLMIKSPGTVEQV
jgi:sugar phosphate isomerase/epimerase